MNRAVFKCLFKGPEQNGRRTLGVDLRQELLAGLVCLQLVNVLHKDSLILEHVTLGPQVEAVVPERERSGKEVLTHYQLQFKRNSSYNTSVVKKQ